MIIEFLETNFGTAKHFIANINDGEKDENTKYQNFLEQFVGNYSNWRQQNIIVSSMTLWI